MSYCNGCLFLKNYNSPLKYQMAVLPLGLDLSRTAASLLNLLEHCGGGWGERKKAKG